MEKENQKIDTSGNGTNQLFDDSSNGSQHSAPYFGPVSQPEFDALKNKTEELKKEIAKLASDYKAELIGVKDEVKKDIKEKDNENKNLISIIITGVLVSLIMIGLDYFHNNYERDSKIRTEIVDFKNNFYSKEDTQMIFLKKEDLDSNQELEKLRIENNKNSYILECFKINKKFSGDCYNY